MHKTYLDNPVFICGHRKTGTTLLINLFDGASDAVVFPDDSGFFYLYYPYWAKDFYSDKEKIERIAGKIIGENLQTIINKAKCSKNEYNHLTGKQQEFRDSLRSFNINDFSTKDMLIYFTKKFHEIFLGHISNPKVWIQKTTSTEIYALELAKWFPNAKFIHIIRDPRDNWGSLKSGWGKRYEEFNDDINRLKHSLLERGLLGMRLARENENLIGANRYKVVKYEDLVRDTEKIMRELACFIEISFSKNLLSPSIFGHSWGGNNFDGVKGEKVFALNASRWKERITREEAQLIEYYFKHEMAYWGYSTEFSNEEQQLSAINHYKWYNFSTPYSAN